MTVDSKTHILVAEDDGDIADMIQAALAPGGYRLTVASDGRQALDVAISENPDLIILDVMMPKMNGWEVCRGLRQRDEFENTPILMLTAIGANLNEMTSPLYGANDHLDKPFVFEELLRRVQALLPDL